MTTWLKKLRLYLLRRQLDSAIRKLIRLDSKNPGCLSVALLYCYAQRNDLIDRIAEIEKTL